MNFVAYTTFDGSSMAREDDAELRKLHQTCKAKSYFMPNPDYMHALNILTLISIRFVERVVRSYMMINNLTVTTLLNDNPEYAIFFGLDDAKLTKINNCIKTYIIYLKSIYEGLKRYCLDAGINHDDVLKTMRLESFGVSNLDELLSREDIQADDVITEKFKKELMNL